MKKEQENIEKAGEAVFSKRDFKQEILDILRSKERVSVIKEKIQDYHDNDIASALEEMSKEERRRFYQIFSVEEISDIFPYLDKVEDFIEELDAEKAADIIEKMDADDAIDVLEELEEEKREELLQLLEEGAKEDIRLIRSYEEEEIGSRMSTNYVSILRNATIKQAMRSVVEQAAENDNITTIYVVDENGTFYGAIELRDLVVAREGTPLEEIISTSYPRVYASESISGCIEQLKDYSEDSIPVLDEENRLLGVITSEDIIEVVDEELGEDYAKLAGMTEESDLDETVWTGMKKRLPWLLALLALGLVVSTVVGAFEKVIQGLALIVCFQSLILDMAGNVGTQSLAVTIRVLMDEKVGGREKLHLVFREVKIGFSNGLILGILSFAFIGLYITVGKHHPMQSSFLISGCIGISLLVSMVISSLMGTIIPMFFHAIKVDPAVASGPLITTVNDLVAVTTYYGLAWFLLIYLFGI
ncbi:MAG: magnesium transporter [Lachnospiraceae bacterium]|nr:magnesium transporter [Lachnospiraceae bacterium]